MGPRQTWQQHNGMQHQNVRFIQQVSRGSYVVECERPGKEEEAGMVVLRSTFDIADPLLKLDLRKASWRILT